MPKKSRPEARSEGYPFHSRVAVRILFMGRIPRTEKEIATALMKRAEISEKEAFGALRRIRRVLTKELELEVPRPKPKEYLDRFSSQLNIRRKTQAEAHKICTSLPEKFKNRKASFLVAAAAIYNASRSQGNNLKIREVSEKLNVGVSSLSKTGQKVRNLSTHLEE